MDFVKFVEENKISERAIALFNQKGFDQPEIINFNKFKTPKYPYPDPSAREETAGLSLFVDKLESLLEGSEFHVTNDILPSTSSDNSEEIPTSDNGKDQSLNQTFDTSYQTPLQLRQLHQKLHQRMGLQQSELGYGQYPSSPMGVLDSNDEDEMIDINSDNTINISCSLYTQKLPSISSDILLMPSSNDIAVNPRNDILDTGLPELILDCATKHQRSSSFIVQSESSDIYVQIPTSSDNQINIHSKMSHQSMLQADIDLRCIEADKDEYSQGHP